VGACTTYERYSKTAICSTAETSILRRRDAMLSRSGVVFDPERRSVVVWYPSRSKLPALWAAYLAKYDLVRSWQKLYRVGPSPSRIVNAASQWTA
jgi:hypothetical protein